MQFEFDRHVIFTENVKQTRLMAQQVSCQLDKQLWSYELKQQFFCFLGRKLFFIKDFFKTFLKTILIY
jgi:hypothetical protein